MTGEPRAHLRVQELHESYRSRRLQVADVIDSHLRRAEQNASGAFLTVMSSAARTRAQQLQELFDRDPDSCLRDHPLFGVPIGVKDNIHVKGVRTSCASKVLENYVAPFSATAVERLQAAGAVLVGKQNLDEFAMGGTGLLSALGSVQNPAAPTRIPGGSSSGSAASVAEGSSWISLGSDTGGSVRLPAAYCGLAAFKPTYGAVSRFGLVAYASSLDQIGPIARTVEDLERTFRVIGGKDPRDSTSLPLAGATTGERKPRVGIPRASILAECEPAVRESFGTWLEALQHAGYSVAEIDLPSSEAVVAAYYVIALGEASSNLARYDGVRYGVRPEATVFETRLESFHRSVRSLFGSEVAQRLLLGAHVLSAGYRDHLYLQACRMRRKLAMEFEQTFENVDLIASPVATRRPPLRAEVATMDRTEVYLNDAFTVTANLAGIPGVVVPAEPDREGVPFGVQLLGAAHTDFSLLADARALQNIQPSRRTP